MLVSRAELEDTWISGRLNNCVRFERVDIDEGNLDVDVLDNNDGVDLGEDAVNGSLGSSSLDELVSERIHRFIDLNKVDLL